MLSGCRAPKLGSLTGGCHLARRGMRHTERRPRAGIWGSGSACCDGDGSRLARRTTDYLRNDSSQRSGRWVGVSRAHGTVATWQA
jgi:hypothetical protein